MTGRTAQLVEEGWPTPLGALTCYRLSSPIRPVVAGRGWSTDLVAVQQRRSGAGRGIESLVYPVVYTLPHRDSLRVWDVPLTVRPLPTDDDGEALALALGVELVEENSTARVTQPREEAPMTRPEQTIFVTYRLTEEGARVLTWHPSREEAEHAATSLRGARVCPWPETLHIEEAVAIVEDPRGGSWD